MARPSGGGWPAGGITPRVPPPAPGPPGSVFGGWCRRVRGKEDQGHTTRPKKRRVVARAFVQSGGRGSMLGPNHADAGKAKAHRRVAESAEESRE